MSETLTAPTPGQLAKLCEPINLFEKALVENYEPCRHQAVFQKIAGGIYTRTIRLDAGVKCTSRIHNTEHHYIVSRGEFEMWSEATGPNPVHVDASLHPVLGVTKPGARRAFHILKETYFTIYVRYDGTDLSKVLDDIMEPQDFPEGWKGFK